MRRSLSLLASAAVVVGLFAVLGASPAAAEFGCPQSMTPGPAALVRQGEKKDQNQNQVVCMKPTTCVESSGPICHGGPDDDLYGGVPLQSTSGSSWYYVVDDV